MTTIQSSVPVPATLAAPIARYAERLKELAGGNALGLLLFGPALAAGPSRRPVDNVLVLAQDDLDLLRRIAAHGHSFVKDGIAAPLVMTPAAIASSRDSFPLELLDISQHHAVAFGDDPFANLVFEPEHVRLQCERELKTVAIALRQRVLRAAGSDAHLRIDDLADQVVRILRGLILLRKAAPAASAPDVLVAFERACGRPIPAIRSAWSGSIDWPGYRAFFTEIATLGASVDGG